MENKLKTFTETLIDQDENSVEVSLTQFMGFRGIKIQTRLLRLVVPIFSGVKSFSGNASSSLFDKMRNLDIDTNTIVKHILENVTETKVDELIQDLVSCVSVNGKDLSVKANFDFIIAGNYKLLFKILTLVIDKNHFFGLSGIGDVMSLLKENSPISQG